MEKPSSPEPKRLKLSGSKIALAATIAGVVGIAAITVRDIKRALELDDNLAAAIDDYVAAATRALPSSEENRIVNIVGPNRMH